MTAASVGRNDRGAAVRDERRNVGGSNFRDTNSRDMRDRGNDTRATDRTAGRQTQHTVGGRDFRDRDQSTLTRTDHRGGYNLYCFSDMV